MSNNNEKGSGVGCLIMAVLVPIIAVTRCTISNSTINQATVRIDKQESVPDRGYLFWATPVMEAQNGKETVYNPIGPQEVFASEKAIFQGKWSASNIVGQIETGGVYQMKVNWFRSEMFNAYRNILEVQRLDKPQNVPQKTSLKVTGDPMQFATARMRATSLARA